MEFRKMVTITLCTRQQKRHWCIEQSYGLCGRGRGWEDLGEWHWNMYTIMYEMSRQSRFDARYWMLGAGALGRPRGTVWGGRREEGSGWGTHGYLWRIHFDIWQNQYNIVKFFFLKKKRSNILWFPVESGQCQCSLTSSLRQSCSVYSKRSHSLKVSIQIWSLKLRTTNEIFWGIPRYHRIHLFFSSEWLYQGEGF